MTSKSIFAISTILDTYCNEIASVECVPGPMSPKKRNEIWNSHKYAKHFSYRFNWINYPHGESKLHLEYYFHNDHEVNYTVPIEDANQLREFLENNILKL